MKKRTIRAKWVKPNEFNVTVILEDGSVHAMNFRITDQLTVDADVDYTASDSEATEEVDDDE